MVSDRRIVVRRGAAVACCLAVLVFSCVHSSHAGVRLSLHDFSSSGPYSQSLGPKGPCSACHRPHGGLGFQIWSRSMVAENGYFNQVSTPNYAPGFTTLCYDCHDNHNATVVDVDPPYTSFNASRPPQDAAFDDDMKTSLPPDGLTTDTKPGYYENIPSKTTYPGTSTYISGHYVKTDPGGGAIGIWDKLPCSDCHDPHNTFHQAFMRTTLGGKTLLTRRASARMAYTTPVRSDAESRDFCIACHGTAEQESAAHQAVTFSAINPAYGPATIVKPPVGVTEHGVASVVACTTCHSHNKMTISCSDCHGTSPTETSPPSGAILGQFWPDGVLATGVNPLYAYADSDVGAHPRHIEAIAQNIFGMTAAQAVAAGRQIAICAFCHPSPGSGGHDFNDPAGPSFVNRVNVHSNAAGDKFTVYLVGASAYGDDTHNATSADYNYNTKTCSNIDCHYEYVTPTYAGTAPNFGWDGADTVGNEPNCRTCHYYRDVATGGSGPGATAQWTPLTPQLPNAHQAHVGGIAPPSTSQSRNYPCSYCHPIPSATNHANGDIDLSTAGNPTLGKEATPNTTDESMTPSSYAVKYGAGPLSANTVCANLYCHGADFGAVTYTEAASKGTYTGPTVPNWPTWNNHLTGSCGTCHDVDTRTPPLAQVGQTFSEGKHQTHIWYQNNAVYGPPMGPMPPATGSNYNHECGGCHGVVSGLTPIPTVTCTYVCHPGGFDAPGLASDAGWASFPSRSHVTGSFVVDFENQDRGFNFVQDYKATPGTVTVFGTPPNFTGGTDICSRCHSTANIVGTAGYLLAKQNWNTANRLDCRTCHNITDPSDSTPVLAGVAAPAKDNTTWTTRGHGLSSGSTYSPSARFGANLTCTNCHASTSAHINGTLIEDRLTTPGNAGCGSCHGAAGAATRVSTHGNRPTAAGAFELNCVECHDPHGSTNIYMVNTGNSNGPLVAERYYNNVSNLTTFLFQGAAVAFLANTARTDFAGTTGSPNPNKICQTCHTTTSVYTYTGATASHQGTQLCTDCHKHDFDDDYTTQDAFKPSGCVACHGYPPNVGCDGILGTADDAPNVMGNGTNATGTGTPPKPFDDGTWGYNVNGHGANGSRVPSLTPNLDCTVCHDLNSPSPSKHNDCSGTENVNQRVNTRFYFGKAADTRNANTSHLVAGYLAGAAGNPQAMQITFDDYCYNTTGCHATNGVYNHRHGTHVGGTPDKIMQFNTAYNATDDPKYDRGTAQKNIDWTPWTIDDLTNTVDANPPTVRHHGVCVSCHDPHGTNVAPVLPNTNSNHMYIQNFNNNNINNPACSNCHRLP